MAESQDLNPESQSREALLCNNSFLMVAMHQDGNSGWYGLLSLQFLIFLLCISDIYITKII